MITDACLVNPRTNARIGPGIVSTTVIVVCFLFLLADASVNVRRAQREGEGRLNAGLTLVINVGFFALYFAYYMQCRPWTGWFAYVFVGYLVVMLVGIVVPPPKSKTEEENAMWTSLQNWDQFRELQRKINDELARNKPAATESVVTK
jgi:hypothetical protein